jgi:large subunit ribosomal protein L10
LAITREKKGVIVDDYAERLRRSQAVIVTEYRGLTVKQLEALRRELRGCESEMVISKNSLMTRSLTDVGMAAPESLLTGPTAVAFCFGDLAAPAKTLGKWAKDSKILVVRGGIIGQSVFDEAGVQALSELPSRDQMRAQVVGVLQSPITGLVNVLAGPMRGFLNLLNARIGQLEQAA